MLNDLFDNLDDLLNELHNKRLCKKLRDRLYFDLDEDMSSDKKKISYSIWVDGTQVYRGSDWLYDTTIHSLNNKGHRNRSRGIYYYDGEAVINDMDQMGIYSSDYFKEGLRNYLSSNSIHASLKSSNRIETLFALLDDKLTVNMLTPYIKRIPNYPKWIRGFFRMRMVLEGIRDTRIMPYVKEE